HFLPLERLSKDEGRELLAASRYGLAEDELLDVLARDDEVYQSVADNPYHPLPAVERAQRRLPVVLWARLYADLEPYLSERRVETASVLAFYHCELREIAADAYAADGDGEHRHTELAAYFRSKADQAGDGSFEG